MKNNVLLKLNLDGTVKSKYYKIIKKIFLLKTSALAQTGAASFWGGVRPKRYSGWLETAPEKTTKN
ncbi:hypothetical protein ASC72_13590 [Flavobacterium sp. Root420]|nr:hypothetical protein ASC72_13590 [Flavobacterium sp. Root420]